MSDNDRMITDADDVIHHPCVQCSRVLPGVRRCEAFPEDIPRDIVMEDFDHRRPHDGDRGLQFKAKPGRQRPLDQYPGLARKIPA